MIAVTQTEHDILSVYMRYPFATQEFVGEQLGKAQPNVWTHLNALAQRLDVVDAYSTQLGAFYSIGWIQPRPLTLYDGHLLDIESQHRRLFGLLLAYPYMTPKQMHHCSGMTVSQIRTQLKQVYRIAGIPALTPDIRVSARLRLYAILGWYIPSMSNIKIVSRDTIGD